MLVVATPDTFDVQLAIHTARTLNPGIETVVRTHNEEEAVLLEKETTGRIFLGENQLARNMTQHALERCGKSP